MTKFPDLFAALASPFEAHEVKIKSKGGVQLHYITARVAMNRFDSVVGPENWWDDYTPTGTGGVLCRLTIRLPDGTTVTKQDVGGFAGMEERTRSGEMVRDEENDEKSGYSDAFKRAAVKFGVARYLYRDGVPSFARDAAAFAESHRPPRPAREPGSDDDRGEYRGRQVEREARVPRSGKALFAWTKEQEQRHGVGLLAYLNKWAKLQEYPSRMVDWDADQVELAFREAVLKISAAAPTDPIEEEALSN